MTQNYLVLNQSGYCFRIVVPFDLRELVGLREIRRSLRTGTLGLAKEKARLLAGKIQRLYRALRADNIMDQKKIQKLVNGYVKETLEWIEDEPLTRERPISLEEAHGFADIIADQAIELKEALVKGDFMQVSHIADRLLKEDGTGEVSRGSMAYKSLCREILKAAIELSRVDAARAIGDYSVQYPGIRGAGQQVVSEESKSGTKVEDSVSLAELINIYTSENESVWSRSTRGDYSTISRVLMRIIPADIQVNVVDKAVMRLYRETLQCLPPRFLTTKKYDGMTAEDIKALGLGPDEIISSQSVNKHLSFVSGLFHYAVDKGYMDINPASHMKVPEKSNARDSVDPFSPEDLVKIFGSPKLGADHPYQFWVPVLGLFTGARRDELCQLYVQDIREEDGVWYIGINQDTSDKSIKNISSKRKIPLHPVVIDLGFIDYVKSVDHERVFPECKNTNKSKKYGHYFGRYFNNLLTQIGVKPSQTELKRGIPNKTFHSFRHGTINMLTHAGVDTLILKQVMGHKEKGVTYGTYFKGFPVGQVYEQVILKMDHRDELIEHLKGSKWTR